MPIDAFKMAHRVVPEIALEGNAEGMLRLSVSPARRRGELW
jgi:hypothetical protein